MISSILAEIRKDIHDDATVQTLMGANHNVYIGWLTETSTMPCITVFENNESSVARVGYDTGKKRDNSPTLQIDIWISRDSSSGPSTAEEIEAVVDHLDVLLIGGAISYTRNWRRLSSSGPMPDPDDARTIHKSLRYGFDYTVKDI